MILLGGCQLRMTRQWRGVQHWSVFARDKSIRLGHDRHRSLHRFERRRCRLGNLYHGCYHLGCRCPSSQNHHQEPRLVSCNPRFSTRSPSSSSSPFSSKRLGRGKPKGETHTHIHAEWEHRKDSLETDTHTLSRSWDLRLPFPFLFLLLRLETGSSSAKWWRSTA